MSAIGDLVTGIERIGTINGEKVTYKLYATNNYGRLVSFYGEFVDPTDAHLKYHGTTQSLFDVKTAGEYGIFVTPERFSFDKVYEDLKELLS